MEKIWHDAFYIELHIAHKEHPVRIKTSINPKSNAQRNPENCQL